MLPTSMKEFTSYAHPVLVAITTTGPDPYQDRITEIAAATYRNGEELDSFQKSVENENADVVSMLDGFSEYLGDRSFCVAHDAERVKSFLQRAAKERLKLDILDTCDLARICHPSLLSYERYELCSHLNVPAVREQSLLDICRSTMLLWDILTEQIRELPPQLLLEIKNLFCAGKGHPMNGFFRSLCAERTRDRSSKNKGRLSELFRKESLPKRRKLPETMVRELLDADDIAEIFGPHGPFAAKIKGYECRPQQAEMARSVATAFNEANHLVVEAGTGVGKSLAYLAPVALWSSVNSMPVVVSTNTKNLQSQLMENDLPLLQEILEQDINAVIIKGRKNYVCLRKLCYLLRHAGYELTRRERVSLACVAAWSIFTKAGDVSECTACGAAARDDLSDRITSDRGECRGQSCEYRQKCFLFRARRKALAADVIIANHSVVFAEMGMDETSPVLPPYRQIVLDEAHNLEDAATSWLTTEISTASLWYLLGRLWRQGKQRAGNGLVAALLRYLDNSDSSDTVLMKQASQHIKRIVSEIGGIGPGVDTFFNSLATLLTVGSRKESIRIRADQKRDSLWQPITRAKEGLIASLSKVMRAIESLMEVLEQMEDSDSPERAGFIQDLQGTLERLSTFTEDMESVLAAEAEGYVFWVEKSTPRQGGVRAWSAPIQVGPMLLDHLYSQKESVVLTSATLSVGGSLAFMKKRVGLDLVDEQRLVEMNTGTPFDYARQCAVMVPLFLPDPADPAGDYVKQLGILLSEVFRRTRGRGMALFTSYDMLRKASSILRDEMSGDCVQILVQGESGSRENIIKIFKKDLESVLMGTHSFWEGVDVVGESLSCLAVTRLPFAVFTDPIVEARCEQVEAEGQSAFMGFSLPNAIIRFRQGFGRLIRHRTDRGIVIITDRRMVARRYGHWFRRSLPAPTLTFPDRTEFLDAVEEFMQAVE